MSGGEQSITAVTLASRTPDHENEAHCNTEHEENGACDVSAPTFYGNHLVQALRLGGPSSPLMLSASTRGSWMVSCSPPARKTRTLP